MEKMHGKPRMLEEVSHFFLSNKPNTPKPYRKAEKAFDLNSPSVGVIIVDKNKIMRFANPTAQHMLGLNGEKYLGQLFNYYLEVNTVSEVSIARKNRKSGIASMQIGETEWKNEYVFLAVLRDVTRNWRSERGSKLC